MTAAGGEHADLRTATTAPGLPRRAISAITVGYALVLPVTAFVAMGALMATVMGVASGTELGLTGALLVLAGLLLIATPVVLVVAVIVMWVATARGAHRRARTAALVPLPLLVGSLALGAFLFLS
jgi:hypothetical protein